MYATFGHGEAIVYSREYMLGSIMIYCNRGLGHFELNGVFSCPRTFWKSLEAAQFESMMVWGDEPIETG